MSAVIDSLAKHLQERVKEAEAENAALRQRVAALVEASNKEFNEIAAQMSVQQCSALMTDERALENLPFEDRDNIIVLGLAKRAGPTQTGDRQWRTWLTPLGLIIRERLVREYLRAKNPAVGSR